MEKQIFENTCSTVVGCEASIIQPSIVKMISPRIYFDRYSDKTDILTLKSVHSLQHQRLNFNVSRPKSFYSLAWDVPFIAPVTTGAALY